VTRPPLHYERDPKSIYAASFKTVRAEANLDRFSLEMQAVAIRLIHACGMVEVADRIAYSASAAVAGSLALAQGAPVLCDCEMVGAGIIRRYLPADNQVIVTLNDPSVPDRAANIGNTRSAAAVELQGFPKPACILGFPVGFVGAAESKAELASNPRGCDFIALRGRKGGSAIASAAVNALSAGLPEISS